jgi:hypothetical protein
MESLDDPFASLTNPLGLGLSLAASSLVRSSVSASTWEKRSRIVLSFKEYLMAQNATNNFSLKDICNYLAEKYDQSTNVSVFEEARTAIATTLFLSTGINISDNIIVKRMVMGARNLRPRNPKYNEMWDLNILFSLFRKDFWLDRPLLRARIRANILIRISIAGRNKDVANIDRESVSWLPDSVSFRMFEWKTKHVEGTKYSRLFTVKKLIAREACICPYRALQEYWVAFNIEHCASDDKGIWFGYRKRSSCIQHTTLAKDCKEVLALAGIPKVFSAATLRHATITWWRNQGIPLEVVMSRTGHHSMQLVLFYYDKSDVSLDITADLLGDEQSSDEEEL